MYSDALDPLAVVRILNELVAVLRRHRLSIAPTEVIDAERALVVLGLSERASVFGALKTTLIKREQDEPIFAKIFASFFDAHAAEPINIWDRLRSFGYNDEVLKSLHDVLMAHASVHELQTLLRIHGSSEITRLLHQPEITRLLERFYTPSQIGFYTQHVLEKVGFQRAIQNFATLKPTLYALFGEQAERLIAILEDEIQHTRLEIRNYVAHELSRKTDLSMQQARLFANTPFTELSHEELIRVRRAVRVLAEKLKGKIQVRKQHSRRGVLDIQQTLRKAWKTSTIPIKPVYQHRKHHRPKLMILCDLSDSVRAVTLLFLEFIRVVHELFSETRSLVFVSELGEVTSLIHQRKITSVYEAISAGKVISLTENSNYGAMLISFYKRYWNQVDRRTTVVILGDARNNYQLDQAWVLANLRKRTNAILWLNPEPRGAWSMGDSVMNRYAIHCSRILQVSNLAELEEAARTLIVM